MAYAAWSVVFGEQPSASKWNVLGTNDAYFDALIGSGTAWTSYTPTWAVDTGSVSIGNGTLTGAYQQFGKTIHFRMKWVAGSTTTFGGGNYRFGLPVAANAVYTSGVNSFAGSGYAEDNGIAAYNVVAASMNSTSGASTFYLRYNNSAGGGSGAVSTTGPFTWANGDFINFAGTYQAA